MLKSLPRTCTTQSRSLNLKFEITHVRCPGLWWNITVFSSRPQSLETLECCLYSSIGHLQTPGFPGGMCPLISLGTGFRCHLYFQRILFPSMYVLCMHMREGVFLLCSWPKKTCELYTFDSLCCIGDETWHLNISAGDILITSVRKCQPMVLFVTRIPFFCAQGDTIKWSLL